ncbi:MAG TPA: Hpt domain-containing protein, partial [Candidatus Acidoferrum sp.]|nr:Hpt domain-containing protein [Candidatus Acidoferrum sp.]
MDELIKDFLQESTENLDRLDQEFVKLESEPENLELLKSIFRTIHTIKGTCGFLGFSKLEALTHAGESLLSLLREGQLRLTESSADALLEMVDAVRAYLREIQATEQEGNADSSELIARLKKLQERDAPTLESAGTSA